MTSPKKNIRTIVMKSKDLILGHLASFTAYLIFGLNTIVCKDIANFGQLSPITLFCIRSIGAAALFWLLSAFTPKEKVPLRDLGGIFIASMLGLFLTQISFLKAITITTPMDATIVATMTPIMTMFVSAIFIKEPITLKKVAGVMISFSGVMFLIFNSVYDAGAVSKSTPAGIGLMFLNGLFFALYLGIFRPLISRYNVVTFMKWMFTFSMIASLPFGASGLLSAEYFSFEPKLILDLGFLVVFATFVSYFLIPYGQKRLRPTLVGMYSYLQPIIAAIVSVCVGMDTLTVGKVLAAALVFVGVGVVNRSKAKEG